LNKSPGLIVCRAWLLTRWCKSTVEECSIQPLVESKGVVGDCESEGSLRQISELRNTNIIRQLDMDKFTIQNEVQKLHGISSCRWYSYLERKLLALPREISQT